MALDRNLPTSGTSISGNDYMNAVAEEVTGLWNRSICSLTDIGGTGNAITASLVPALTAGLVDGMAFWLTPAANNTGAVTIEINEESSVGILDAKGDALLSGALTAGRKYLLAADSGDLRVVSGDSGSGSGGGVVPVEPKSSAYTLVLADAGKTILHPSADTTARTWTIPSNVSVPFPVGTVISFVNQNGAGAITLAITSNTLTLAGAGSTGSRSLAANGIATIQKIAETEWIISGVGLT